MGLLGDSKPVNLTMKINHHKFLAEEITESIKHKEHRL